MDTIEVINAVRNGDRVQALDKIADILYGKASEAMKDYKEIVASSFFDKPEDIESPPEETSEDQVEQ